MQGPMLETLDHTIRIGSTPTFLHFDLYLYSAYAAHYVCYIYIYLCNNVTSACILIGCLPWSIKGHTDGVKSTTFFLSEKFKWHLNFYWIEQIDYIFPCVCTAIDHSRRHNACKEQQSRHSTSSCVVRFCSLHAVTSSVIYYSTHTRKNVIYLLNINWLCCCWSW